jgi:hypothetical protein
MVSDTVAPGIDAIGTEPLIGNPQANEEGENLAAGAEPEEGL